MPASPIDLTTVSNVKTWLSANGVAPSGTSDDAAIQACITSFSAMFLRRTGKGNQDGSEPVLSPFVTPVLYNETYDGNGGYRFFLRNSPIQSVTLIQVGFLQIPESLLFGQSGYVIDGTKRSISLRGGSNSFAAAGAFWSGSYGGVFRKGIQNCNFQYTAGFTTEPDDIEMAARKSCALRYKQKDWIGLRSKAMAQGAGTVSYDTDEWGEDVQRLIIDYTRYTL